MTGSKTLQPESKTLAILLFTLTVVLDPHLPWYRVLVYLIWWLGYTWVAGIHPTPVLRRSSVFLPFFVAAVIFGPLLTGEVGRALLLLTKGWLAALALAALSLSADFPALVQGLRRLGLPALLAMMLNFMYRYLDLLIGEAKRMEIARNQRFFGRGFLKQFRVLGNMIGNLFLRTYERGERIYTAMLLRGYDGNSKVARVKYSFLDYALVLAGGVVLAILGVTALWL